MEILFITPRLPYPPFQGDRLKIYHLLRILSRNHRICLLSLVEDRREQELAKNLQGFCQEVRTVIHSKPCIYKNLIGNIFSHKPFQVAYFNSVEFAEILQDLIKTNSFDVIHTHLIRLAPYTVDLPIPRVLDLTDAISNYLSTRLESSKNPISKATISLELNRMIEYEKIIEKFDVVSICAEPDRQTLLKNAPNAKIEILQNGIDLAYFHPLSSNIVEENSIIFTGNMTYAPNEDGIIYFCEQILPLIVCQIPNVKLYIVGKSPSPKVRRLASDRIIVTGLVMDLREYYARAQVAVCPIRFGAGTLNKVIEPMAMGIPVVSTSISCAGMNSVDGENILFGDTPEDFADATIRLLTIPSLREKIAIGGKNLVLQSHDWEQIVAKLENIYQKIQFKSSEPPIAMN
jgi:polysaccharide biosynthesis protein PslH